MSDHIGELAALYALGALEPNERDAVEAHAEMCNACARLLARAQEDVTTIAEAQLQHAPPPELELRIASIADEGEALEPRPLPPARPRARPWLAAVAAVVAIALLPSAYFLNENIAMHQAMLADEAAMVRISSSPHKNVAFAGMTQADAHVMYAPDGSWYCVIVRGITRPLQVVWPHDGDQTVIGTAVPRGDVAMLYLPKSHRMDELALMDGTRVVANAKLVY